MSSLDPFLYQSIIRSVSLSLFLSFSLSFSLHINWSLSLYVPIQFKILLVNLSMYVSLSLFLFLSFSLPLSLYISIDLYLSTYLYNFKSCWLTILCLSFSLHVSLSAHEYWFHQHLHDSQQHHGRLVSDRRVQHAGRLHPVPRIRTLRTQASPPSPSLSLSLLSLSLSLSFSQALRLICVGSKGFLYCKWGHCQSANNIHFVTQFMLQTTLDLSTEAVPCQSRGSYVLVR